MHSVDEHQCLCLSFNYANYHGMEVSKTNIGWICHLGQSISENCAQDILERKSKFWIDVCIRKPLMYINDVDRYTRKLNFRPYIIISRGMRNIL